ncbi:hypothetical protein GGF47_003869, partial [Coemansia sp. RSA 2524]
HPWLSGEHTATRDLLPDVIENFNARATLRRAVLKIQAVNRMRKLSLNHGSDSSGSEHNSFDSDKDHPSYESNEKEPADEKPKESLPGGWTG